VAPVRAELGSSAAALQQLTGTESPTLVIQGDCDLMIPDKVRSSPSRCPRPFSWSAADTAFPPRALAEL
jgi:hypothetical protein